MTNFVSKSRVAGVAFAAALGTAGLIAPTAGAYSGATPACQGASIIGGGASLQKTAQTFWGADQLNTTGWAVGTSWSTLATASTATSGFGFPSATATDCGNFRGDGKTISYASVGSGGGRNSWSADGDPAHRDPNASFVSTDEPPSPAEEANIESVGLTANTQVETIPFAQAAVAIIVKLPTGCALTDPVNGRRALIQNLEAVMYGAKTKWGHLVGSTGLTPASCVQQTITRVVRKDSSGSTFAYKKVLDEASPGHRWTTGATDYTAPANNTVWPSAVVTPTATGGGAVANLVKTTPSSIGYVDLATARANDFWYDDAASPADDQFWLSLTVPADDPVAPTFTNDPAKDPKRSASNPALKPGAYCSPSTSGASNRDYSPPASTADNWYAVTAAKATYKKYEYPICTLTYILAYDKYRNVPGATEPKARTTFDYLRYLQTTAGQQQLALHDYQGIPDSGPHPIRPIVNAGVGRVNW